MAATSIFSIFGECSGNVRSTPTPNDCLRTVNVSRTPLPWRLITIPSKTWTRRRWPSITWKWTRTVSPALKRGTWRSWARSMESMILLRGILERIGDDDAAVLQLADAAGRRPDVLGPELARGAGVPEHREQHVRGRAHLRRRIERVDEHEPVGRVHRDRPDLLAPFRVPGRPAPEPRRHRHQPAHRKPMRFGGQYTKNTVPMRFFRGTAPHSRESHDWARWSPMKKYSPAGTCQLFPKWDASAKRLVAWTYGAFSS